VNVPRICSDTYLIFLYYSLAYRSRIRPLNPNLERWTVTVTLYYTLSVSLTITLTRKIWRKHNNSWISFNIELFVKVNIVRQHAGLQKAYNRNGTRITYGHSLTLVVLNPITYQKSATDILQNAHKSTVLWCKWSTSNGNRQLKYIICNLYYIFHLLLKTIVHFNYIFACNLYLKYNFNEIYNKCKFPATHECTIFFDIFNHWLYYSESTA